MAEEQAAHHLLNVLEERNLHVDLDKILLGFEDEATKSGIAAWVDEYLHEDTLLTKEELELYQTLKKRGLLHQYESAGEHIRPILDHEIAAAIDSLQTSTTAIEAQCKVLEAQKEALMKLKALDKPNLDVEHERNERRRKEGQEKSRLDVAVDDAALSLTEQLTEAQRETETAKATLKSYLAERLGSDDQILSRLPGFVAKIVTEGEKSEDEKSVEQWCTAIVSFRTAEIKARVDTVYLNSLAESSGNGLADDPESQLKERKAALQAEMEELHSEIASVAEMVVEHEIKKPINEMKERRDRGTRQARSAWLNYVLSTLDYMGKRLDTITTATADVDELQRALAHMDSAAAKCMPDSHSAAPTPVRRRTTSGPSLAFTPMVKLKPTASLELPAALQDALRHAGMSLNHDSMAALQDALVQAQLERGKKLREHYASTATWTHDALAERSRKADTDWRVISSVLYKHTPFHQTSLTDRRLEQDLQAMERELERRHGDLREAEGSELSLADPRVRAFVAKYGRQ